MLLSLRHGFIFIETPKAGSSSMRTLLQSFADVDSGDDLPFRHQSWIETLIRHAPLFARRHPDTFLKFAVIRHPVDWALSWHAFTADDQPFEEWWDGPGRFQFIGWRCPSQISRLAGYTGRMEMDLLIPFDHIRQAPRALSKLLGIELGRMPHCNRNRTPKAAIGASLRRRIERELADDLDLYQRALEEWTP